MRATWFTYEHPCQLETSVGTEVRDDISFCQDALVYFYDGKDYGKQKRGKLVCTHVNLSSR